MNQAAQITSNFRFCCTRYIGRLLASAAIALEPPQRGAG
jgi:hypothetical protein